MMLFYRILISLFRRSWRAYSKANFVIPVETFRIPISNGIGLELIPHFRSKEFEIVLKAAVAIRPQGIVIDIGANIGKLLLNLADLDRKASYIGFEPLVEAAAYVQRLIVENKLLNHSIIPVALSDHIGTETIHYIGDADVSAALAQAATPRGGSTCQRRVPVLTADVLLADFSSVALIKIDVEGAEVFVLRGMLATIVRHRPPMLLEVLPYASLLDGTWDREYYGDMTAEDARRAAKVMKERSSEIEALLRKHNYVFYACTWYGHVAPTHTLDRGDYRGHSLDFLALPSEIAPAFLERIPHIPLDPKCP